jgi:hypothetical protein
MLVLNLAGVAYLVHRLRLEWPGTTLDHNKPVRHPG